MYTWYSASWWIITSEALRYDTCFQGISVLPAHPRVRPQSQWTIPAFVFSARTVWVIQVSYELWVSELTRGLLVVAYLVHVFVMWCTQRKVEAVLNLCPPTWDSLGFHSTLVRPVTSQVTIVRRYTNWIIIQGGCIKRWSTSDVCLSRTLDPSRE